MSKYLIIVIFSFSSSIVFAQTPFSFNYQGLARDAQGEPLSNQEISLLMSLISGFENGIIEFQEEHVVTTNEFGIFSIQIGQGNLLLGNLRNIDWGEDSYFLRTEMDPTAGENYINLGTSQLNSVPYALFAAEAANASGGSDNDSDPNNEIQNLDLSGNQLSISGGNSVILPITQNTDNQSLSLNGKTLLISGANSVDLSAVSIDNDANPTNELQFLNFSGNQLSISGGNTVVLPSGDGGTDNQTLSLSNKTLSISGGNSIDLSPISNDADADPANEFQSLNLIGSTLSISNGNSVNLQGGSSPWMESPPGITYDGNFVNLLNADQTNAVSLSRFQNGAGGIDIFGNSSPKIEMFPTIDDAGAIVLEGANDFNNILISSISSDPNKGWIATYNENGAARGAMFVAQSGRGGALYNGLNGNSNIQLTAVGSNVNHGFITVDDDDGVIQAGMYVDDNGNGRVFADFVDNFVDNPEKSNQRILYSMIQGPEAAAYLRGTGNLQEGKGKILFPGHFQNLIEEEGMTIMITPLSAKSKGIAVIQKGQDGFEVQELLEGQGNYQFDWEVKGVRRAYGIYKSKTNLTIPVPDKDANRSTTSSLRPGK